MPIAICKGCRKVFSTENHLSLHIRNSRDPLCEHYCSESIPSLVSKVTVPQVHAMLVEDEMEEEEENEGEDTWLDGEASDEEYAYIEDAPGPGLFPRGNDANNANTDNLNNDETDEGDVGLSENADGCMNVILFFLLLIVPFWGVNTE
ncbi:hypothetical protein AN958_10330 [Leucoagaricus sp. SymC.cos]|nr:hypothetical protein AN958_10330 [Leucoagaricus sp. SymC.cos]